MQTAHEGHDNAQLQQERYELENLRRLYDIDQETSDYEKTGARVIASDATNWFYSFTIDKGEQDGIAVDTDRDHYAFSAPYILMPDIASSEITDPLVEGSYHVIVPIAPL